MFYVKFKRMIRIRCSGGIGSVYNTWRSQLVVVSIYFSWLQRYTGITWSRVLSNSLNSILTKFGSDNDLELFLCIESNFKMVFLTMIFDTPFSFF